MITNNEMNQSMIAEYNSKHTT